MKRLIVFLFLIFNMQLFCQEHRIEFNFLPNNFIDSSTYELEFNIDNLSTDTLIMVEDVYVQGLFPNEYNADGICSFFSDNYSPNLISFYSSEMGMQELDCHWEMKYLEIPRLLVILPNSLTNITLNIEKFRQSVKNIIWKINGNLKFAIKEDVDKFFDSQAEQFRENYLNALICKKTYSIEGKYLWEKRKIDGHSIISSKDLEKLFKIKVNNNF